MKTLVAIIAFAALMYGCSSVPLTGRKQLSLVSDSEVLALSLQQYNEYIGSAPKSTNATQKNMVTRIGQNIANAVARYMEAAGTESALNGFSWEFTLVEDNQVNAFCMPGGKIVVYTGILPYTQDETGLAVVIGHEVAHAVAKHANERMSQQVMAQYGSSAVGMVLGNNPKMQAIGQTVYGLGTEYGIMLPYSRKQEFEADYLGLIFMAIAGYDPSQAIPFWERMSQQGTSTPEFMRTHPSDAIRIEEIRKHLPEALQYYTGKPQTPSSGNSNTNTNSQWKF